MVERLQSRTPLVIILIISVVLRLAATIYIGNEVNDLPGTFDQISYNELAQRVIDGHGFSFGREWWPATPAGEPTAHWSYLYTTFLVVIYSLFGYLPIAARLLQAVLVGIFMPWLIYRLGNRFFNERIGLVAAAITAVYSYFVFYAANLMTESFYIIGILWILDLAGELGERNQNTTNPVRKTIFLGLALALTVLLRQVFLLFLPILFVWLLWQRFRYLQQQPAISNAQGWLSSSLAALSAKSMWQMVGILSGAAIIMFLAIAPWTWHNYQVFDRFVLLNTNAGFAFFWGNHPIHGTNFISILPADGPSYQSLIPADLLNLNEAELEQELLSRGVGFIQEDFGRYLLLSLSRAVDYFQFWPSFDSGLLSNIARVMSFGLMWPFMAFGFIFNICRALRNKILILYLFVVFYTLIHLSTWTLIRYRLPIDAVLLPFAAFSLMAFMERFGQKWTLRQRFRTGNDFNFG
jgi:hypothetical protein